MSDEPRDCPPRHATPRTPERKTLGTAAARIAEQLGTPFMPWQRQVLDTALEIEDGQFVYREVIVTVPRQSGKTTSLLSLILARALHRPRQSIIYTAQSRADARKKWSEDWLPVLEVSPFKEHFHKRLANGDEALIFGNGSRQGLVAGTKKSGHGSTLDLGIIDEAFAQADARLEQALKPAMITRNKLPHPGAQLWVVSTAGTLAISPYLWSKVEAGREIAQSGLNKAVAYFEWSAGEDEDPSDEETWWRCMPALGRTATAAAVRADFMSMDLHEFMRAYLNMWCLAPSTLVSLADGSLKKAEDLLAGDRIVSFDEMSGVFRPAVVAGVAENGVHLLYRVTTRRGRVIETTGNHTFWCWPGKWVRADELSPRHRVLSERTSWSPETRAEIDPETAWFLGAMVGDGACGTVGYVRFTNTDDGVVKKMRAFAESLGLRVRSHGPQHRLVSTAANYRRDGNAAARLLREHGLWKKTCYQKRVPLAVLSGGRAAWCGFLAGLLDTDGCVSRQGESGSTIYVSVNEDLLRDCQHLLALLGAQSTLTPVSSSGAAARLSVQDAASNDILAHELPLAHYEKARKLKTIAAGPRRYTHGHDRYDYDRVKSVEILEQGRTVAVEVVGTHTHVTAGLVTHNTTIAIDPVIPIVDWMALADLKENSTEGVPVVLGVDVTPGREYASIAAAGVLENGSTFVDVLKHQAGTGWVAPAVGKLVEKHEVAAVIVDPASPAGSLVQALSDEGGVNVQPVQVRELAEACEGLFDAVEQHRVHHPGQQSVTAALDGAVKRWVGDGKWAWGRRSSGTDISPLVACTLAHWGAESGMASAGEVWSLDAIVADLRAQQAGQIAPAPAASATGAPAPGNPAGVFITPIA